MPDENFSKAPQTIKELRALKNHDGTAWTPREALIWVLRQIDSGEMIPEELIVLWDEKRGENGLIFNYASACKSRLSRAGLVFTHLRTLDDEAG